MAKFEVGKTYETSFIGDSAQIIRVKVVKRTEKTVVVEGYVSQRLRIYEFDGDECVRTGSYRFAPIFCASRQVA